MKTTILILLAIVSIACAGSVQFEGVITDIDPDAPMCLGFPVHFGDPFTAQVSFVKNTHLVNNMIITVGDRRVRFTMDGTQFTYGCNNGLVYYRVEGGTILAVELDVLVQDCLILLPPIDEFYLNEFTLCFGISGLLTEIPKVHP
jgi:hypothetical protein